MGAVLRHADRDRQFALSSTAPSPHYLQVLWACAIVYMVARLAFWFGYRKHPLLRAPGMSATA